MDQDRREPGMMDRRAFVQASVLASVAAAAPVAVLAASAAQDPSAEPRGQALWKPAPCRLCGVGCGLLVRIQDGRAVAVRGDPDSPVAGGTACVKGYYAPQMLYARDRITRALVRRSGALSPFALADAHTMVADRIRESIRAHGPDSVALYGSAQWTAEDALVAARLFRGSLRTRMVDTNARLHTASADAAMALTYGHSVSPATYEDIDHADTFVLWNVNLAESDPVLFSRMLERRRTNPSVRVVDLATTTSRSSYAADRRLLFAPRTELMIANAICQHILERGWTDRAFVDRHVAFKRGRTTFDAAADMLNAEQPADADFQAFAAFLRDFAPERAARTAGIAADDIRWLASLYGDPARKVVTVWGAASNEHHRGVWVNNALHNIHLLTGKVCTPGNAAFTAAGQPGGAALLGDVFAHQPIASSGEGRGRMAAAWGVAPDALDARPAHTALSIFRGVESGAVRVLWIQATNPMVSLPDLGRFRRAVEQSGCFVIVSEAFPTPTTDVADVVLPAAMWIERDGTFMNGERRLQRVNRLVRPPGDAQPDSRHMMEVARRLGVTLTTPADPAALWDVLRGLHASEGALPDIAALSSSVGLQWPWSKETPTAHRYNTAEDPAASATFGRFDFHGHVDHRAWIWLRPWTPPPAGPTAAFPLWLTTGRVVEHWGTGSMTRRIPTLHRAAPRAWVEVGRADARAAGIRDGDRVRLTSRRGSVELEARVEYRNQPPRGVLFAPLFDEDAAIMRLAGDEACPLSGQPDSSAFPVRIERIGGPR